MQYSKYEIIKPKYDLINREKKEYKKYSRYIKTDKNKFKKANYEKNQKVTIMCVGDLLCEERMYKAALYDELFHFRSNFRYVKKVFEEADFVIGNLETMIDENAPYTGEVVKIDGKFHNNAPKEYLDGLKYAGFDMLAMSNNHNLDCGIGGIERTISSVDEYGFIHTGLFLPGQERDVVIDVNGINIAVLSYSTWFNRNETKLTQKGREIFINEYNPYKVHEDICNVRKIGAEYVIVYIHWGIEREYRHDVSKRQRMQAKEIADAGADFIIGSHTHSIQPFEYVLSNRGKQIPVAYSLGNFATSEMHDISRDNVILVINLEKNIDKEKTLIKAESRYLPCHVFNEYGGCKFPIVPTIDRFNDSANVKDSVLNKYHEKVAKIFGKQILGYEGNDFLTTDHICEWIGAEKTIPNMKFTQIRFAQDAIEGCLALASAISSSADYVPSPEESERTAKKAIEKGAIGILSTIQIKNYPCIIIDKPVKAYITICSHIRAQYKPKAVAITGNIGKTSTMELINAMLRSKFNTYGLIGNANTVRYAGIIVQGLKKEHEAYIQETMEGPPYGAASNVSKISQPSIAVVTKVSTSHLDFQKSKTNKNYFETQEQIWESCLSIQDGMPKDGILILNGDDPFQQNAESKCRIVYYGIDNEEATYRAADISNTEKGVRFICEYPKGKIKIQLKVFGKHNVLNALAGFAVGKEYGMSDEEIAVALENFKPNASIRQNLVTHGGYKLYIDCYNITLDSTISFFDATQDTYIPDGRKRIVIIGDGEWTDQKTAEFIDIGKAAIKTNFDIMIFYGELARYAFDEYVKSGKDAFWVNSDEKCEKVILDIAQPGDLLAFKGGRRAVKLEYVIDDIFGMWYSEEGEREKLQSRNTENNSWKYTVYTNHITLNKYTGNEENPEIPSEIEGLPVWGIGNSCFAHNKKIKNVVIPENVRNIRYCAFYMCEGIEEVTLPNSLKRIGASAFSKCKNLKKVTLGNGVTDMLYRCFGNCVALHEINIPKTVQQIGNEAFLNCHNVKVNVEKNSVAEKYCLENGVELGGIIC